MWWIVEAMSTLLEEEEEEPLPYREALLVVAEFDPVAMFHAVASDDDDRPRQRLALQRAIREDFELLVPFLARASPAAVRALSERCVRTDDVLLEVSRVFDCCGVERQEKALLAVLEPGGGYRRQVDEHVLLPPGVELARDSSLSSSSRGRRRVVDDQSLEEERRSSAVEGDDDTPDRVVDPFVLYEACEWIEFFAENAPALRARALEVAALHGKLDVLQTLFASKDVEPPRLVCAAAYGGHVQVLEWLRNTVATTETSTAACGAAAGGGHRAALQWLLDRGFRCDATTCAFAALRGRLEILRFLREEKGVSWDETTCESAARGGHVSVLAYAHAEGCPWGSTCRFAAEYDRLDILKFARAHGCPWDEETCLAALDRGHVAVLEWCCINACPWPSSLTAEVLEWYHSLSHLNDLAGADPTTTTTTPAA
mmetsp:Transcript_29972/g.91768  ORF Transcript_29972/g.91768 Transcript_29972/m.91768 type:complete len:428 (-) Transcript_29972:405-1688(-)